MSDRSSRIGIKIGEAVAGAICASVALFIVVCLLGVLPPIYVLWLVPACGGVLGFAFGDHFIEPLRQRLDDWLIDK